MSSFLLAVALSPAWIQEPAKGIDPFAPLQAHGIVTRSLNFRKGSLAATLKLTEGPLQVSV